MTTISSLGTGNVAQQSHVPQHVAKGGESREIGPDVDGDADDTGPRATAAAPTPTVNASGQTVGQLINTKA